MYKIGFGALAGSSCGMQQTCQLFKNLLYKQLLHSLAPTSECHSVVQIKQFYYDRRHKHKHIHTHAHTVATTTTTDIAQVQRTLDNNKTNNTNKVNESHKIKFNPLASYWPDSYRSGLNSPTPNPCACHTHLACTPPTLLIPVSSVYSV